MRASDLPFPSTLNLVRLHRNHIYTEKLISRKLLNINLQCTGWCLQAASEEPDLIPATRDPRILVHGHHVVVSAQLIVATQDLPQQSDLMTHCDFCGGTEKWPDSQSERRVSANHSASLLRWRVSGTGCH